MMDRPIITHLMPKEKFTKGFIEFTKDAFPQSSVFFILYGSGSPSGYTEIADSDVYSVTKIQEIFLKRNCLDLLKKSSLLIVNWVNLKLLLEISPFWNKTLLMFWGGDLYPYVFKEGGAGYRTRRLILQAALKKVRGVINLTPSDQLAVNKICSSAGIRLIAGMTGDTYERARKKSNAAKSVLQDKKSFPLRILLGNSATPTNRHEEAIDLLSRFIEEDICIIAPLSYGDTGYRDKIIKYGKEKLGAKFKPMTRFLDRDEYDCFLQTISIGIFNNNRQQGLGNINSLLLYGAKVFLSDDNPIWMDYKRLGCAVASMSEIEDSDFEHFIKFDKSLANANAQIMDPLFCYQQNVLEWTRIYELAEE